MALSYNYTLTLGARFWFIMLEARMEMEINPSPRSWLELSMQFSIRHNTSLINSSVVVMQHMG